MATTAIADKVHPARPTRFDPNAWPAGTSAGRAVQGTGGIGFCKVIVADHLQREID